MRRLCCSLLMLLAVVGFSHRADAVVIANSVADFSGVQGQDSWFYGLVNRGDPGVAFVYDPNTDFEPFDTLVAGPGWNASDAQVGANNNDFLNIGQFGGHPTGIGPGGQDSIIWATRRYVSEVDGLVKIAFDLRKTNVVNNNGGGITGRIFVDGVEVFTQFIDNFDGIGVQSALARQVTVGTLIDFVIDPTGIAPPNSGDGDFSARADGSHFSAVISQNTGIPEPVTATLGLMGLGALGMAMRRRAAIG